MHQNKIKVWLPLCISISMAAGMLLGYKIRDNFPQKTFFEHDNIGLLSQINQLIKEKYMDPVSLDSIQGETIDLLLNQLDPHSQYISPSELEDINNSIEGQFLGIGVEYDIYQDSVNIIQVLDKSPAQKAGLKNGDIILKIGNKNISGTSLNADSIRNMIRGKKGSDIKLTILRNGSQNQIHVSRELIPMNSIEASYRVNDTTGYIRISSFSTKTYREFMLALQDLQKKPLHKLILDLRDNGGGVLDEAVEIADEFLDSDKLISYTEGSHSPRKEYRCRRKGQYEVGKLIVLCNEESASASEILMGALQDWDRATIIGNRSFGKGLVQEQFDLSNGGAIRLSVARYFTPLGRSIQRSYKNGDEEYFNDAFNENRYAEHQNNVHPFVTQKGKKLLGENGITPDIMIPNDSIMSDSNYLQVHKYKLLSQSAYAYYSKNKNNISQFPPLLQWAKSENLNDSLQSTLIKLCKEKMIDYSKISTSLQRTCLDIMKSYVARYIWGQFAYFELYNSTDSAFIEALKE